MIHITPGVEVNPKVLNKVYNTEQGKPFFSLKTASLREIDANLSTK
jgi:hypothetical protein